MPIVLHIVPIRLGATRSDNDNDNLSSVHHGISGGRQSKVLPLEIELFYFIPSLCVAYVSMLYLAKNWTR